VLKAPVNFNNSNTQRAEKRGETWVKTGEIRVMVAPSERLEGTASHHHQEKKNGKQNWGKGLRNLEKLEK